jgi:hypothetical protein
LYLSSSTVMPSFTVKSTSGSVASEIVPSRLGRLLLMTWPHRRGVRAHKSLAHTCIQSDTKRVYAPRRTHAVYSYSVLHQDNWSGYRVAYLLVSEAASLLVSEIVWHEPDDCVYFGACVCARACVWSTCVHEMHVPRPQSARLSDQSKASGRWPSRSTAYPSCAQQHTRCTHDLRPTHNTSVQAGSHTRHSAPCDTVPCASATGVSTGILSDSQSASTIHEVRAAVDLNSDPCCLQGNVRTCRCPLCL